MKLNIVIKISEESFKIVNGKPLVSRLVENITTNIKFSNLQLIYNPLIYLQSDDPSLLTKHQAYINTLKNVLTTKEEACDYRLYLTSNKVYLDNDWLYNLLIFINKHNVNKITLVSIDKQEKLYSLKDWLKSNQIGTDKEFIYCINDILE